MEPGRDDREEGDAVGPEPVDHTAAMEPGRDDREEAIDQAITQTPVAPLWSPVVTTGKRGWSRR